MSGRNANQGNRLMPNPAYDAVTNRIIASLESGVRPWQKPWSAGGVVTGPLMRPLRVCGTPYTGINVLNLWIAGQNRGFNARHWMTYKGAQELGAQVRKGAKSELAFYVGKHTVAAADDSQDDRTISFLRCYHVFNADEIDNLPGRFRPADATPEPMPQGERNATVDAFVAATGASIAHGGDKAYYRPSIDAIQMPHLAAFNEPGAYYTTLLHELTHWTAPEARCNRALGGRFGDMAYAAEELVAELGAAFLCADLAISDTPRDDHAQYIAGWLSVLKNDNRAIFRAASLAEKAAGYLHGCQPAELAAAA
jgi:antirestriction protein ArdC